MKSILTAPLPALETLLDITEGDDAPLSPDLASFHGPLRFPSSSAGRLWVVGNFVSSLDGVVSLKQPGHAGGGAISGDDPWDRLFMALLRACADIIIEGAGTFREAPQSLLTAQDLVPACSASFRGLREALQKPALPLRVLVTEHGDLDLSRPLFMQGDGRLLLLTRPEGAKRLAYGLDPEQAEVLAIPGQGPLRAGEILAALSRRQASGLVLLEGGPQLMSAFLEEKSLDELFLTLAPQVSGRGEDPRPGFVQGLALGADDLRWASLLSVKRVHSELLLRYRFPTAP